MKSCELGVLAFSDLVASKRFLTILREKNVLGWDPWVHAGTEGGWLEFQNKGVYLYWAQYCILRLTCSWTSFPSISRKEQGCPLGPWWKKFTSYFLEFSGSSSQKTQRPVANFSWNGAWEVIAAATWSQGCSDCQSHLLLSPGPFLTMGGIPILAWPISSIKTPPGCCSNKLICILTLLAIKIVFLS